MKTKKNIEEKKELFEYKYLDQIENYDKVMECSDEELKDVVGKYVSDKTPMGDVLLTYDLDDERFIYYSHTSNIQYKFLDTLCRQFVLEYRCMRLYCNIDEDVKKIEEELKREKEEKNNKVVEEQPKTETDEKSKTETDEKSKKCFRKF